MRFKGSSWRALATLMLACLTARCGPVVPEDLKARRQAAARAAESTAATAAEAAALEARDGHAAAAQPVLVPERTEQLARLEIQGELAAGQTLSAALAEARVPVSDVHAVVTALSGVYDFRSAQPGARFEAVLDGEPRELELFRFVNTPLEEFEVARDHAGRLVGRRVDVTLDTRIETLAIEIKDSLYQALEDSGQDPELASLLSEVFAWDIDFYRDQHPGDVLRVIVEKKYRDQTFVYHGRILAAEYAGKVGTIRTFFFATDGGPGDYFLQDGRSARKFFLATPLKYTRVSSSFSHNRRHPILGYTRAHLGVDYAAPRGTPVRAMASGVVTFAGYSGGSGNLVKLRHGRSLESSYAHLDRIAAGIRPGTRVQQKQVVGSVGETGLATGPHLHFAVKKDGRFINPQQLKLSRMDPVAPATRARFEALVAERLQALESLGRPGEPGSEPPVETAELR